MTGLSALGHGLRRLAQVVVALLLASMFATFLIQIFFRYVLNDPLGWTVEWVAIAWLWGILFGYAFVVEDRDIIRLDIVFSLMPRGVQRAMEVIAGSVVIGILLYSLPAVWGYVTFMKLERTAFLRIRFDYVFAIYLPFVLSVILRTALGMLQALRGTGRHALPEEHALGADYD